MPDQTPEGTIADLNLLCLDAMLLSGVNKLLWRSKWREDAVGWISSRKPTERFRATNLTELAMILLLKILLDLGHFQDCFQ